MKKPWLPLWDISGQKRAEEALQRLNRALRAISECDKVLVRAADEQTLLREVCYVICRVAGYRMAWVGLVEHDTDKSILPVAWGGAEDGYLANAHITWADTERGRGPTGTAARTGKTHFFQDFAKEPAAAPWRDAAMSRGYRSSIALPLSDDAGNVFAVFTLYDSQPNGFTPDEVELLEQLVGDVAYGIGVLRTRVERDNSRQRFQILSEANSILLTSEKPEQIIQMIASRVMEHLGCDAFFNFILDEVSGRLRLNAYAGIPLEATTDLEWLKLRTAICSCTNRNGCPVISEDILENDDVRADLVRSFGIQAYACHPLRIGNNTIGTLSFGTRTRTKFSEEDLDLMSTVADQVSAAIQRTRTEESLRQTSEYLDNLFNYANAPIIVWNPDYEITRFNHAFERLTGHDAVEVVGKKLDILFPEASRDSSMQHISDATAGRRWEVVEIPIVHKDGSVRILLWNSATLYSEDRERPIATIAQGQDITERKKSEQIKDEFIGLVSHELKTPITVIVGAIDTALTKGVPRKEAVQLMEDAAASAESLAGIVDNLLELSRAQANRLVIKKEPVDVAQAARNVTDKLKNRSDKHRLIIQMADDLPLAAADSIRVERILHNLVENAIKYSPRGGSVTIFARQDDDSVVVGVKDQGIGIAPELQQRIFMPFERLDKSGRVPGVGLGLNVCRRLVEAHSGRIWVESPPGQGATFYFSLPLIAD